MPGPTDEPHTGGYVDDFSDDFSTGSEGDVTLSDVALPDVATSKPSVGMGEPHDGGAGGGWSHGEECALCGQMLQVCTRLAFGSVTALRETWGIPIAE
eukprot:gene7388-6935_t